jgi:Ca2+-binding EF-hand superfamily protein
LGLKCVSKEEFDERFKDLDTDGNGTVDKQEMVHFVLGLLSA